MSLVRNTLNIYLSPFVGEMKVRGKICTCHPHLTSAIEGEGLSNKLITHDNSMEGIK